MRATPTVIKSLSLLSLVLAASCSSSNDLDCRYDGAACAPGFVCTDQSDGAWACAPAADAGSDAATDGDESDVRAHRYVWITAQRDVSIEAIELLGADGQISHFGLRQCPVLPDSQQTCGNIHGPPRGCGVDTAHRIPDEGTLIGSFGSLLETGDSIVVYMCDESDPADAIEVQIGVEGYVVVTNPLVSCPLEAEGANARCTVPELPAIVEEPDDPGRARFEAFEAEPRDPEWADEAEQTILDNIASGTTTEGESVFDSGQMEIDEWCVEAWGTWEIDVDCRTTMCRVIAIGGSIVQSCLVDVLHDLVPHGFSASGSWDSDRWTAYYSREGYRLPRF